MIQNFKSYSIYSLHELNIDGLQSVETSPYRLNWSLRKSHRGQKSVFCSSLSLPLIFPLEETSSLLGDTATYLSPLQWHTHTSCHLLTHTHNTHTHRNIQSLTPPWSLIYAPVRGRGAEWQYGIPGGTERCGDRHPNPLSQQNPKHRKTRQKRRKKKPDNNNKQQTKGSRSLPAVTALLTTGRL